MPTHTPLLDSKSEDRLTDDTDETICSNEDWNKKAFVQHINRTAHMYPREW